MKDSDDPNEQWGYSWGHWLGCQCDICYRRRAAHLAKPQECQCRVCKHFRAEELRQKTERRISMAGVHICDRCETIIKTDALAFLTIQVNRNSEEAHKEICPGCIEDFLEFYDNYDPALSERPRAYHKPYEPPKSDVNAAEEFAAKVAEQMVKQGVNKGIPALATSEVPQDRPKPRNVVTGEYPAEYGEQPGFGR